MLRVGKIYCSRGQPDRYGLTAGFINVVVKNYTSGLGWTLSPYFLKDDDGVIMENDYQSHKVYAFVDANSNQPVVGFIQPNDT